LKNDFEKEKEWRTRMAKEWRGILKESATVTQLCSAEALKEVGFFRWNHATESTERLGPSTRCHAATTFLVAVNSSVSPG